jgi:hypothetical protein
VLSERCPERAILTAPQFANTIAANFAATAREDHFSRSIGKYSAWHGFQNVRAQCGTHRV